MDGGYTVHQFSKFLCSLPYMCICFIFYLLNILACLYEVFDEKTSLKTKEELEKEKKEVKKKKDAARRKEL